ncbi:MAG: VWA domain-containing protein [Elusimicrobiota bacterium]|jgi:uncharacterized protein YegL|nr:VWA domain-containing protein [Elusimicrobiota bacterium]
MKKGLAELVFILDRSGSMGGLEADTIGGFNSLLEKQKTVVGECRITTALFDNDYELLHDRIDVKAVSPITKKEYFVRGSTALLDAIGKTIGKIDKAQRNTDENYRAEKVMFVIITDGEENSSRKFSSSDIKALIERKKSECGWEFVFLGANIDAVETAGNLGISKDFAQDYLADEKGIELGYDGVSYLASEIRSNGIAPKHWKQAIQADYQKRKKTREAKNA